MKIIQFREIGLQFLPKRKHRLGFGIRLGRRSQSRMLLEKLEALTPDIRPGTGQSLDQLPQDRGVGRLNNLPQATRRLIFLLLAHF
ncbi:MAG: hypothetical protein HYY82_07720 [Deltaproteobacteria bacterium]|nr:hypothetical protein [Deltaproteobacteria bacterium]